MNARAVGMWYSRKWRKRFFKQDIKDMQSYLAESRKNLVKLQKLSRRKHHPFIERELLPVDIASQKYDRLYYSKMLRHDREMLKKLG
jgi:hypothetical protein